jgi:hypothetical protein
MENNAKTRSLSASGTLKAVAADPVKAVAVDSVEAAAVEAANEPVAVMSISDDAMEEKVEVSPSLVASGRTYKFRVLVTGSDGSEATAYALLNVLYSPPPPPTDKLRLQLKEGWNLIALPGEGVLDSGSCSSMDELYAFIYVKEREEYMTLAEAVDYMGEARLEGYLRTHAFWVYSFSDCSMSFALEEATSFNDISMESGWNFVPVTQDMEGNSLSDIGGDCDFERSYYWDAKKQDWRRIGNGEKFDENQLYTGFISKVEDSCDFGWGAIITPPPLPE